MIAKVTILFAALAAVHASVLLGHGALVSTGVSTSARSQDAFGNYAFGYDIKDGLGAANSRSEVGDAHGNKKGSYTIADIDGRADESTTLLTDMVRASVKTNKPGTLPAPLLRPHRQPLRRTRRPSRQPQPPLVAYGGVLGHGAALGLAAPAALAYGAPLGLGHGAALGLAAPTALAYGAPLGLGHGLGLGKTLLH
ncbi:adult-specific rigid cuticular protein 15.7 [Trichonephila inaurata madagascariensis]|uniref:Adult-specific rigid cuticular protein 15.7 n=1 Tax=Trichonephila inaurata madagascariensis TaxID=2747483 RepID=A0A8X6XA50_9ARAC|nr:adult-specific rigid cuticular protein 15.7 [Trichonephila inaurata madagascariensis]